MAFTQNAINNTLPTSSLTGTISTAQVAASAITYAKIQNESASTLLGNPTGSSAAPSEITLGAGLAFSGSSLTATGGVTINTLQIDQTPAGGTYGTLSGVVNSSNTIYTVSNATYVSGSLMVFLNGQEQTNGSGKDWTETSPGAGTFTFAIAPPTGSIIQAAYIKSSSGSVTTNSIQRTVVNNTNASASSTNAIVIDLIAVTGLTAGRTLTFTPVGTSANPKQWAVKDESGNAGTFNITIASTSGTFDGLSSTSISTNSGSKTFYDNGTNFFML